MTVGKASALAAGFVGAVALGVAIGPTVHDRWTDTPSVNEVATTTAAPSPEPAKAPRPARAVKPAAARADNDDMRPAEAKRPGAVASVPVTVWEPELRDRVKKVLSPGTKMELAAEDFQSAEQFVTVAHAARNTGVPFILLKHRILNEQQTLAEAIHKSKPELDEKVEVARAREAARLDLSGN
jgi:hypothetical protein